jgi:hypothetical protein
MKCGFFTTLFGKNDPSVLSISLTSHLAAGQSDFAVQCSWSILKADLSPEAGPVYKPIFIKSTPFGCIGQFLYSPMEFVCFPSDLGVGIGHSCHAFVDVLKTARCMNSNRQLVASSESGEVWHKPASVRQIEVD